MASNVNIGDLLADFEIMWPQLFTEFSEIRLPLIEGARKHSNFVCQNKLSVKNL
jgi:hypothetical protein